MPGTAREVDSLLDEVMPRYEVHERHEIWVPAEPQHAYEAVKTVSASEVRLFEPLMRLRRLGRSRRVLDPGAPLLEEMRRIGFVRLGEHPGDELVLGAVGRFWSPTGNRPRAIDDFSTFADPGYAKAAMNFTVSAERGGSRITTETRVLGTDPRASRKFRFYWLVIRPGSGAIRRSWLKAIRQRLERTRPENARGEP